MDESTPSTTYNLVFDGRLVAGRNAADVEKAFADRFSEKVAKSVFGNTPRTLKRGLTREQATEFQKALEQMGMVVMMVPSAAESVELSLAEPVQPPPPPPSQPQKKQQPEPAEFGVLPQRAKPKSRVKLRETYSIDQLDKAFAAQVELPPASRWYIFRLLPVTLLMLLLPAIYVGITLFSGYGVYWVATEGFQWFFGFRSIGIAHVVGFAACLFASVLLTLFLLKPLVARTEPGPQPVRLDPGREPALFHLVERITESIGAPAPHEILVDTNVNASARLTHGVFSRSLTLTIGLPLFYGTTVNTLTGILAHEFGHFTQRWGMRAFYLVQRINFWFYMQVHERDSWDNFVDNLVEQENIIANLTAMLAGLGSFVCRLIMVALGYLAGFFSLSLSRQMEFDADRYEIALLGSDEYRNTAESLRVLGAGFQLAVDDLALAFDSDKTVDNLPKLAAMKAASISEVDREQIVASIDEINTSAFDTHPPDKARIRKAEEAALPPRFELEGTAGKLLRELEILSRQATLQWYRSQGVAVQPEDLTPLEEFESEADSLEQANTALNAYFGELAYLPELLQLPEPAALEGMSDEELQQRQAALSRKVGEQQSAFIKARDELLLQLEYQYYYGQALFWRQAGYDIDLNAYRLQLTTKDTGEIKKILAGHKESETRLRADVKVCAALLGNRLGLDMEVAVRKRRAERNEIAALHRAYVGAGKANGDYQLLVTSNDTLDGLIQMDFDRPDDANVLNKLRKEATDNEQLQSRIRNTLAGVPDPNAAGTTLADSLTSACNEYGARAPRATLTDSGRVVRQFDRILFRILGRMAEIGVQGGELNVAVQ